MKYLILCKIYYENNVPYYNMLKQLKYALHINIYIFITAVMKRIFYLT